MKFESIHFLLHSSASACILSIYFFFVGAKITGSIKCIITSAGITNKHTQLKKKKSYQRRLNGNKHMIWESMYGWGCQQARKEDANKITDLFFLSVINKCVKDSFAFIQTHTSTDLTRCVKSCCKSSTTFVVCMTGNRNKKHKPQLLI